MNKKNDDFLEEMFSEKVNQENTIKEDNNVQKDDETIITEDIEKHLKNPLVVPNDKEKKDKSEDIRENEKKDENEAIVNNIQIDALKKDLAETKSWGHQKNKAYVNAKKKITEFLHKRQENGTLYDEEVAEALSYFTLKEETDSNEETLIEQKAMNPFVELKSKLDKEFSIFKKYAKIDAAEEKYNTYFEFWPMLDYEEQQAVLIYLQEEEPSIALDKIMTEGEELYNELYQGIKENKGFLPYVKSIKAENKKLSEKVKLLEEELDNSTSVVHSRPINSRSRGVSIKELDNDNFLDYIYSRKT